MSRTVKRPYQKSRRFDKQCRCHGGCPYCLGNRMHKHVKKILRAREQLKELNHESVCNSIHPH